MQMQTGPAPKQSMRAWLALTGLVELANIGIFCWGLWSLDRALGLQVGYFAIAGLATMNVILLQGGAYWLLKRGRFFGVRRLRMLRRLYAFNALLLLVFPLSLLATAAPGVPSPRRGDLLTGLLLYLFGLGEFVHYFVFKINMRGAELRRALRQRRPIPARFRRELARAQRETTD